MEYLALYAIVFLVISTIYSTAFLIQGSFLKNWDKTYDYIVQNLQIIFLGAFVYLSDY